MHPVNVICGEQKPRELLTVARSYVLVRFLPVAWVMGSLNLKVPGSVVRMRKFDNHIFHENAKSNLTLL